MCKTYFPLSSRRFCSDKSDRFFLNPPKPPKNPALAASTIPLSPVTADFPGFDETQPDYFYECSASHSRYTYETMVHGSHSTTGSFNCNGSKATTSCSEQDDDTTAHYQTSRMAVVRKAYESRFPTCHTALDLLAKPLRKSSLQDYEGKWSRFCNFL